MRKRDARVGKYVDHNKSGKHLGIIIEARSALVVVSNRGVHTIAGYDEISPCNHENVMRDGALRVMRSQAWVDAPGGAA